ncbi:hypothetical protein [Streptococcus pluranimalium]|uniref:hypothetical protein n=1 Tax=Streptococcus pluranimalium TaxID=82348 RepID=UPI003138FDB2
MFRLQNQANGKEQEYANRAALLIGLEGEENRCLQLNMSSTFYLFHIDKQGAVMESMELTIPSSEDTSIKELLGQFGLKKDDKKGFSARFAKKTPTKESQSLAKQENQISEVTSHQRGSLFKGFLWTVPMVLSLTSLILALQKPTELPSASHQEMSKKQVTVIDHGPDVFARYFIGSYFSGSDTREKFLSEDLSIDDITVDKATPTSVLLESQRTKGDTSTLTYVITIRDEEEKLNSKRLELTVKKSKNAIYGYLIHKAPRLNSYP